MRPSDPDVDTWVSSLRSDQAADERSRRWWLTRQAREQGSLAGVIADLADRGVAVAVQLRTGHSHHGEISMVGSDFCALHTTMGNDVLIAHDAIASLRGMPGIDAVFGDCDPEAMEPMSAALSRLAETSERVRINLGDPDRVVTGSLISVGVDVATVKSDGGDPIYVALASIAEVSLPESG